MLKDTIDPRWGFKLEPDHHPDCWYGDGEDDCTFIVPNGTVHRDRIGRRQKHASSTWYAFRCNDPKCPAQMLVRWDVLSRFVTAAGRQET